MAPHSSTLAWKIPWTEEPGKSMGSQRVRHDWVTELNWTDESERGEWKSWPTVQHSENKDHGIHSHHFMANRWGNSGNSVRLYIWGLQNHCRWRLQPWNKKTLTPWKESYDQPRQHIKKQRHYFANSVLSSQSYGFSSSHVWMWELDYQESWAPKNWYFQTVVLKSPLDRKEIKPINLKGNQSWVFIGRTDAEAGAPILWCKELTTGKTSDIGKDGGHEEKQTTENETVGWHHWVNGHEFEQTQWDGETGSLVCYSPWGHKESDTTKRLILSHMSIVSVQFSRSVVSSSLQPQGLQHARIPCP